MKQIIQLRNGFINLADSQQKNIQLAMMVSSELMQFGYLPDQSAINVLSSASKEDIVSFHNEVITYLKKMTGSNRSYKPFWKGFPEEVMEKSECELWIHQILHYWSNGTYEPSEWTKKRSTAFEQPKYTKLTAGDEDRYLQIFTDLVSVNQSLTPDDLEIIKYFVNSGAELRFPAVIPFKENLCTLASLQLDVPVNTVTDVLRIAVGMSGGDVSLPAVPAKLVKMNRWSSSLYANPAREKFKFKKFSRKERKYILGLLEKTNCDASEAVLKDQRWVRLGEILHPGEYVKQFPKSAEMFYKIRNEKVQSFYGKVNQAFNQSFEAGLKKLSERPGELIRRLDSLLRNSSVVKKNALANVVSSNVAAKLERLSLGDKEDNTGLILKTMAQVLPRVSNKVLFETYQHFEKRDREVTDRRIMIKGARMATTLPSLPALKRDLIDNVQNTILSTLKQKFSQMPSLGKVWIDEELKNIPLPANMRSLNSALKPQVRGIRVPMGNQNAKVIRAYVHWFDEEGNRDIDLTAIFIGMGKVKHIGWNGQHNCKEGVYSGDVRHRKGACAEYIDIDVATTLKAGYKYVIMDIRNYNGGTLAEITDCVFGYMEREFPKANKTFVPATLANSVRLASPSANTIVAMIDVETQEYVFLDIDSNGIPVASANFNKILDAIKPYMEPPKLSVYDLLKIHADSRGNQVTNPDEAETKFTFDQFSESYVETLKYMGV